jgi:hypothetical protein
MEAAKRLTATSKVEAKGPEVSDWWKHLEPEAKKQYINEHPASKYAEQAAQEAKESGHQPPRASLKPSSEERKQLSSSITQNAPKIAISLKKSFPKITHAVGALKHLATGKKLEHEEKEVLHEMGEMIFRNQLAKHVGGNAVQIAADIGITAIKYGIEKYKEHQAKDPNKDSVQSFVEAVGEGVEKAEHAPVPAEHAKEGSSYRKAIASKFKSSAKHVTEVLQRSYPHIKPATHGLVALAKGEKPTHEQKHAIQHMGKHAMMLGIAALPGGLAAHLTAGVATSAVTFAYKKIQQAKNQNESPKSLIGHFVEAIGEGLEHAFVNNHLGGHEGGHGDHHG